MGQETAISLAHPLSTSLVPLPHKSFQQICCANAALRLSADRQLHLVSGTGTLAQAHGDDLAVAV